MNRLLWIVLPTMSLLFGCATSDQGIKFGARFAGASKGKLDCDNTNRCDVAIVDPFCDIFGCSGSVDHDPINLINGRPNVRVTWTLPSGYTFCRQVGDGVFLKTETSEQFELAPDNGHETCTDSITITAKNTVAVCHGVG